MPSKFLIGLRGRNVAQEIAGQQTQETPMQMPMVQEAPVQMPMIHCRFVEIPHPRV